jgi:hypothetical protein
MDIFVTAFIISVIFFVIKFIEMRFIERENKPLKFLIRDSLIVYVSVIAGHFVLQQISPVIQSGMGENPQVFTDNPDF